MNGKMLIACKNEDYIMMLAQKFFHELDDMVSISTVTDCEYLMNYISNEKVEERILILGREYYFENLDISKFECVVLLDENEKLMNVTKSDFMVVNPFLKIDVIYDFIVNQTPLREVVEKNRKKDTKLIAVYSPIGGSGKTTIAYGLSMAFSKTYKKVLYINPGALQDFGYLFNSPEALEPRLERMIARQDTEVISLLMEAICSYGFDFVPPTRLSFSTLGISLKDYVFLISEIKRLNKYDYIVVDMMSELNVEMAQIIGQADKVICVGLQDAYSEFRIKRLFNNMDVSNAEKYYLICNKYNCSQENYIREIANKEIVLKAQEHIEYEEDISRTNKISDKMLKILEQISMNCI